MTETELTDRLRESIVLDGPDAWRTNGYLQDAQRVGLSEADALKRAKEIGQEVNNNSLLFQNILARIARMAQPSRHHLRDQDLQQIMNAATSLNLSPDFVRNRWVPTVLERIAPPPVPKEPEPVVVAPPPPVSEPTKSDTFEELLESQPELSKPEPVPVPPVPVVEAIIPQRPEPVIPTPQPIVDERPVTPSQPNYYEPSPVVRAFTATPAKVYKGQPVTLAWEVENLLAVTIDDLGEGLSPKNRGWVKPSKTTDYTLFDANNNPLSTVRVEVLRRDRSGVYGVLFALVLLALIYWFIKSTNSTEREPEPKRKTEHAAGASYESPSRKKPRVSDPDPVAENSVTEATDTPTEKPGESTSVTSEAQKKESKSIESPSDEATAAAEPVAKPASPADARQGKYEEAFGDKSYDKIELGADEQGWRRARSNGRWGFVNDADEWVIKPEYEAVTPFRGNTAAVFQNGKLMTINRSGEQVRN